ncbi:MAG: carbohydrate kinase family protein [Solirubrobacteraceae bacterium]
MSATLCLGEALVDLIGESPVASMRQVDRFEPHFGGATANVAVFAARAGARIALAGAAGDDRWGHWLRDRLDTERVQRAHFPLVAGLATQLAFVAVDHHGEPTYQLYGELGQPLVDALSGRIDAAVDAAAGLFISSNTLAAAGERKLTMRARERALEHDLPVVFDCNLRLHRWSSRADAAASANACVPGALLVHANRAEAELLTGEADPERAALALRKAGAELVVLTLGSGGAIVRGAGGLHADASAGPARVLSTIGAGDALTGTLLARLALSGFYPAAAAAALDEAVAAGAAACEHWGALD